MAATPLVQQIERFIENERLLDRSLPVIVGVSGGADSVALLHILNRLGYSCIACHCNFNLRGDESLRDFEFTRRIAEEWGIPFETVSFDTLDYARTNGLSVEMACRRLRYDWFEERRKKYGAQAIAVAHHRDDSAETLLLNLIRGTGIAGLTSMRPRNGFVVRPLLPVTRKDIEAYLSGEGLDYVVDHTNLEPVYVRNKIRLQVLPLLRTINPSVDTAIYSSMQNLREVDRVYRAAIEQQKKELLRYEDNCIHIPIAGLLALPSPKAFLFELLSPCGFVSEQIDEVLSACDGMSGKMFLSREYRLVKDRDFLILERQETDSEGDIVVRIETWQEYATLLQGRLSYRCVDNVNYKLPRDKSYACFDLDKLSLPLVVRHWKAGDRFVPFGMKGSRKLSDYFSDRKYSLIDKSNALLLCSGDTILWILGERVAEGYRINSDTRRIVEFNCKK